jgi:hypothetical protein
MELGLQSKRVLMTAAEMATSERIAAVSDIAWRRKLSRSVDAERGNVISGTAPAIKPVPPRIVWAGDGNGLAELGTLAIVVWRGQVTRKAHARQIDLYESVSGRFPGRAAINDPKRAW